MPNDLADTSDAGLVRRALAGDQTAVSALIDRHADAVYAECRATLAAEDAALDAVHAVFVRAGARLSKLADPSRLREWLLAVTHSELIGRQPQRASTRGRGSVETTPSLVASLEDVEAPERLRLRIAVDMMVALGFGPAVPLGSLESADSARSLRFSELWPSASVYQDDWEWTLDGFPLDLNQVAPLPRLLVGGTVAAAIALLVGLLILPLLRPGADAQVAGIVESTDDVARALSEGEFRIDDDSSRQLGDSPVAITKPDGSEPTTTTVALVAVSPSATATSDSNSAVATTAGEPAAVQPTPSRQPTTTTGPTSSVERTTTTLAATASTADSSRVISTSTDVPSPTAAASTTTTTAAASTTTTTGAPTTTTGAPTTTTGAPTTTTSTTGAPTTTTGAPTTTTSTTTTITPNVGPTLSDTKVSPGSVRVSDGTCVPGTATVSAEVSDSDGELIAVVAEWSANGSDTISTPLNDQGDGTFEASIGPWFVIGTQTVVVIAMDDDGAEAQGSDTVRVRRCPGN